jgi:NTP pyrophosphatase (non-canonical NTP hydrolase)
MAGDPLQDLALRLRDFAAERDWDRFHSPKNLAMALTGEAGELAAEFQWLTEAESRALDEAQRERVRQEAADVLLYLVRLADKLGIDLVEAAHRKMELNGRNYPADLVRGSARKYTEYGDPSA